MTIHSASLAICDNNYAQHFKSLNDCNEYIAICRGDAFQGYFSPLLTDSFCSNPDGHFGQEKTATGHRTDTQAAISRKNFNPLATPRLLLLRLDQTP